ncbi:hypothetical protein PHJA_002799300 [Phtheirospermum japonicum]|uniref:Uncharacterized protein n=1 Tax=Phtheirospermum japonicum TaxID=374723 RepID=A0A830D7D0_9LAMI|nr:hypothetical protein PHJA_002799300 [Phtheirospermum japonicum]
MEAVSFRIKNMLGGRVSLIVSGGATLSSDVKEFLRKMQKLIYGNKDYETRYIANFKASFSSYVEILDVARKDQILHRQGYDSWRVMVAYNRRGCGLTGAGPVPQA